jgi:hypothetical protein
VERLLGQERAPAALELLRHADTVIREILYIGDFAKQKLFFRRVRIPPLLHVYWDSLFINHAVRKAMRHFVRDPAPSVSSGETAASLLPRMIPLAHEAVLPADDIEHMRDFLQLVLLARRYYFLPFDESLAGQIRARKKEYKQRWRGENRQRYRIKISFQPLPVKRRTLAIAARLLLRRQRGYRWLDRLLVLHLSGPVFHALRRCNPSVVPRILRKSAMGVDALFK